MRQKEPTVQTTTSEQSAVFNISEAAAYCGIGRSMFAELTARGRVPSFKIGARRLYRRAALDSWLEGLEVAQSGAVPA